MNEWLTFIYRPPTYTTAMKTRVFISACLLASSWLGAEETTIVKNQWVWRNGQLVHIPKMETSPLPATVDSGNIHKVQWGFNDGKLKKKVSGSDDPLNPEEKIDPSLEEMSAPMIDTTSMTIKANEQDLSSPEIKAWGRSLKITSMELKELKLKLKGSSDPFEFKAYLIKSKKQKDDLALYRQQVAKIKN